MSNNSNPQKITPHMNLEQIRKSCIKLAEKRALVSAGAAVVPVPFLDVAVDVGILSVLLPEINERFGLDPEYSSIYDQKTKTVHWDEVRKRGVQMAGLVATRTVARQSLSGFTGRILTKQVTKFIPLGGSLVSAGLGYYILKKIAMAHIDDCYQKAKQIQQRQQNPV